MAKKYFTDESLTALVDEIKTYTDTATSGKADSSHTHDSYMTVMNPAGAGYFSLNRKSGTTAGDCSFAEGYNGTASGHVSHAEGDTTTASGNYSHSEGAKTTASGAWSHAEGYYSTASGSYSHAEGYSTIASAPAQHAQGKYNVEDTDGKYAHIVGNGTANVRANIHTLDWDGNAWFEGNIKVGGTGYDDSAAKEVVFASSDAVETDIIPNDAVKYSVQSLTDAQKSQVRTNIGAADANKTALKTQIYKRNLLDNSDFMNPINQRGATSYTGTYSIDRWRIWNTDTLTKNNGYISVVGSLFQYLDPSMCENKVYTLAAKKSDGTVILCSQNILNSFSWHNNGLGLGLDGNVVAALGAGDYLWAALYEGEYTAETLPEYQPKGYTAELLECQRYFLKVPTGSGRYAATLGENTNQVYFLFNTNVPMRVSPAVSGSLRFTFRHNTGSVNTSDVTLSPYAVIPGGIMMKADATWSTSTTSLSSYMSGVIATTAITDLSFSADL